MGTSSKPRLFFPLLVLQLILGAIVIFGLFRLGLWKTAVLEICKLAVALPQAFRLRSAALEQPTLGGDASSYIAASVALLAVSALSDSVLISYDVELGHLTPLGN